MTSLHSVETAARQTTRPTVLRGAALAEIVLAVGLILGSRSPLAAEPSSVCNPFQASTSPEARQSAIRSIPMDKLNPADKAKVDSVLSNVTIFRRMPVRVVDCDPDLYLFLVRHPDVVANIWEVLGVSQLEVRQIATDAFRVVDNAGTHGTAEILYQGHDTHLVYAEGCYQGPLAARPARGRCLMLLKTGYVRETNGRYYVTSRLDCFVSLEPGAAELLTKTFQAMLGKVADANFTQTMAFVGSLSHTAEVNHRGVRRLSTKLDHVQPELREQLAALAERIAKKNSDYALDQTLSPSLKVASREEPAQQR